MAMDIVGPAQPITGTMSPLVSLQEDSLTSWCHIGTIFILLASSVDVNGVYVLKTAGSLRSHETG